MPHSIKKINLYFFKKSMIRNPLKNRVDATLVVYNRRASRNALPKRVLITFGCLQLLETYLSFCLRTSYRYKR